MTRGGMKILRGGGAPKIFRHSKGGALKKLGGGLRKFVYFKPKSSYKIEPLARGATKISSFEFQYLHPTPPPLVILNELSPILL